MVLYGQVTGGSDGIGFEVSLKLVMLGANVIIASDNLYKVNRAAQAIKELLALGEEKINFVLEKNGCNGPEGILKAIETYGLQPPSIPEDDFNHYGKIQSVYLNLADLKSVTDAVTALVSEFKGKVFDHVVLGASVCPEDNIFSIQGHEIAFATNVLGHFALVKLLLDNRMLRIESQVLALGCEDYILAEDCTRDFTFPEGEHGYSAYRRSKLGMFWFMRELQRRYSYLAVCIVHPGYSDTRIGMDSLYCCGCLTGWIVLSPRSAASVVVVCVQYGCTLAKGAYYHNTCGQMILNPNEIALNEDKASSFWNMMDDILSEYMRLQSNGQSENINGENSNRYTESGGPRYVAIN